MVAPLHERIEQARQERLEKEAQPLVTTPKEGSHTWDVFYKGKEGYAEHIQIAFDDPETLMKARQVMVLALQAAEAETLPRDKDNARTSGPPPARPNGAPRPADATGVAPQCPVDGAPMNLRAAGTSKNTGKPYPAFWSCSNYATTGCKGRMNA